MSLIVPRYFRYDDTENHMDNRGQSFIYSPVVNQRKFKSETSNCLRYFNERFPSSEQ